MATNPIRIHEISVIWIKTWKCWQFFSNFVHLCRAWVCGWWCYILNIKIAYYCKYIIKLDCFCIALLSVHKKAKSVNGRAVYVFN